MGWQDQAYFHILPSRWVRFPRQRRHSRCPWYQRRERWCRCAGTTGTKSAIIGHKRSEGRSWTIRYGFGKLNSFMYNQLCVFALPCKIPFSFVFLFDRGPRLPRSKRNRWSPWWLWSARFRWTSWTSWTTRYRFTHTPTHTHRHKSTMWVMYWLCCLSGPKGDSGYPGGPGGPGGPGFKGSMGEMGLPGKLKLFGSFHFYLDLGDIWIHF